MFGIIFKVALHIGSLYIGWKLGKKILKWLKEKQNKKIWNAKRENLLRYVMQINDNYIDVKKVAQVSFERFLKLYEVSPEKWIITNESGYGDYDEFFPIYKYEADASEIPLFWETGEDLQKYREWVKEKFAKGEAALYQQARDRSMKLLTKSIKEDLERKRKRAEEEIAELEAQVKKECEQTKEKQKEIQLTLEPQTSAPVWTDEGEEPVINYLNYTTKEVEPQMRSDTPEEVIEKLKKLEINSSGEAVEVVEPSNETSVSQSAAESSSTCIQPNLFDYNYICHIRDGLMQQMQMANMQAIQNQWLNQCQSSIMSQVQYNNIMQSTHPFHF